MTRGRIITALLGFARRIGRWLLRRLLKFAIDHVVGYMLGKVEDFRRRRDRAKLESRRERLTGRIDRWTAAARWIAKSASELGRDLIFEADRLAEARGLELVAAAERE